MKCIPVLLLCICAASADEPRPRPAAAAILNRDSPMGAVAGDGAIHWYTFDVDRSEPQQIVATASGGDVLLRLFNDDAGHETGFIATPELPVSIALDRGRYRLSVESVTRASFELVRTLAPASDVTAPGIVPTIADNRRMPGAQPVEAPELIRGASGVLGASWRIENRAYRLEVANGYSARLAARCHRGSFEVTVVTPSGRILPLLPADHEEGFVVLRSGEYRIELTGKADASAFSLDVTMIAATR